MFLQGPGPFSCKPYTNVVSIFLSAADYWGWIMQARLDAEREARERLALGTTLRSWKGYCLLLSINFGYSQMFNFEI